MSDNEKSIGVLAYQDILEEIKTNELVKFSNENNVEACSYDMTIGTIFRNGEIINSEHPKADIPIVIKPGEIVSMFTLEELKLPNNICATAFAINSQSSQGLLVLNPGHIDPGFEGPLTVKVVNLRQTERVIQRKSKIFTVIFEKIASKTERVYRKNESRADRERKFNEGDVEAASRSLSQLITLSNDSPYPSRHEVKEIVSEKLLTEHQIKDIVGSHFLSRISLSLSVATLLLAGAAAVIGVIPIISKNDLEIDIERINGKLRAIEAHISPDLENYNKENADDVIKEDKKDDGDISHRQTDNKKGNDNSSSIDKSIQSGSKNQKSEVKETKKEEEIKKAQEIAIGQEAKKPGP